MLEEPYGFGECKERMVEATVTCECFKNESIKVWVTVRKRGDWIEVSVLNIFEEAKEGAYHDESTFKIEPFLNEGELGKNPRKRIFWCLARTFEVNNLVSKTVPAMVTLEKMER